MANMTSTQFVPKSAARFSMAVRIGCRTAKISQENLGEAIGKTRDAVAQKVGGRIKWNPDEMDTIAYVFGVELPDMINGTTDWLDRVDPVSAHERLEIAKITDTSRYLSPELAIAG